MNTLELGAVYAAANRATNFIDEGELKAAVAVGSRAQLRHVDVIAEAEAEVVVVEAGRQDGCVVEYAGLNFVGDAGPETKLERLAALGAGCGLKQELEAGAGIDLEGGALAHDNHAGHDAEATTEEELAAAVYGEAAVEEILVVAVERLVGAVEVMERAAEVEAVVLVEDHKPE